MKITKIILHNVGPYLDQNQFVFNMTDKDKSMILIGGKNGTGKTTLFNSIKICLYGCKAFGFESNNSDYITELNKLINSNEKLNKNGCAKVSVELLMDDGKNDDIYVIERKWTFATKKIKEIISVYKNEKLLGDREKADFENYLHQLIPPGLFKFYFFDGERIGDFVFNSINNSDFKNAFLKLCGLDTLEIIKENFKRIYKNKNTNTALMDQYSALLAECKNVDMKLQILLDKQNELMTEISKIEGQLILLEKDYFKQGGIEKKQWDSMHEQIRKEELHREELRRWLKEIANDVLPFLILRSELESLKIRVYNEESAHNSIVVQKTLNEVGYPAIQSILGSINIEPIDEVAKAIIQKISEALHNNTSNNTEILFLSTKEQLDLIAKINSNLAFDSNRILLAVEAIKSSLESTKKIRKKIEKSDIGNWSSYLEKNNSLLSEKATIMEERVRLEQAISDAQIKKLNLAGELKKLKIKYEADLKAKSVNDLSAKAILAFDKLQMKLYKQFVSEIESNFIECFNRLINKQNLLDGIIVDEELNVYPYKNRIFKKKDLLMLLDKQGEDYVLEQVGYKAFEILKEKLVNADVEVMLPIEIKQTLSAGEKQIFIMSLYYALSKINKINVPYIIDTPFARIDSHHRKNILEQFFMKLKGQIIILSTDEEIVQAYNDIITPKIADRFILEHQSNNRTRIIEHRYFGDEL